MNPEKVVETTLRVRFAETDAMGIVYHANYLAWFEVARGDYFRAQGQDYVDWEKAGYLLPVAEAHARYHAPARFGDLVTVRTWLRESRSRSVTLEYEVRDTASQTRLVTGWTRHVCMDRQGVALRLPPEMIHALKQP